MYENHAEAVDPDSKWFESGVMSFDRARVIILFLLLLTILNLEF